MFRLRPRQGGDSAFSRYRYDALGTDIDKITDGSIPARHTEDATSGSRRSDRDVAAACRGVERRACLTIRADSHEPLAGGGTADLARYVGAFVVVTNAFVLLCDRHGLGLLRLLDAGLLGRGKEVRRVRCGVLVPSSPLPP